MSLYLGTTPIANTGYDKANTDLSNLTSQGQNISNWSSNVTNCITEIPQDIKLELNNGTLTLKAGSKVYVPNGFESDGTTPKFDVINITSDISTNYAGYSDYDAIFICLKTDGSFATHFKAGTQNSGTSGVVYSFVYRTDLNKIYDYEGDASNPYEQISFPIGIFKYSNNGITSINQVFNGFGYIGSTIYALPRVKGISTRGKNPDGTYNNTIMSVDNVITYTFGSDWTTGYVPTMLVGSGSSVTSFNVVSGFYINENGYPVVNGSENKAFQGFQAFSCAYSSGKPTNWNPERVFSNAVVSGWSMPSSRHIALTLGASGATYTAPANGWVYVNKNGQGNQFFNLVNQTKDYGINEITSYSPFGLLIMLPVGKGDVFRTDYNLDGTLNAFRFYYAEGEN